MTYLLRHLQVLFDTLGRMWKAPLPTLMTLTMLGIAMALPLVLHKVADSLAGAAGQWRDKPRISLFLKAPASPQASGQADGQNAPANAQVNTQAADQEAIEFGRQLLQIPAIDDIEYISPQAAITEFKRVSGFGAALDNLPENPLPPLLVVYPDPTLEIVQMELLVAKLSALAQVDSASFDQLWLQRLAAILALFKRGVAVLSVLMAVGVILIISNTVRLGIVNRRDEIEIIDQVGGTRAFIRRPFLYFGALQGLFGALFASAIGNLGLYLLGAPVAALAALYESSFRVEWFGLRPTIGVALAAAFLGWLAARATVDWRLHRLRPTAV